MVGHDPYGSPSAIGARTTRPQDLKWVADPNNARSYEEMKQAASTVESQVNQLKLVVHKALGGGDFDAALKARKELEGEWWDTKEQMESHKIVSYQQADVYIKRAASRMSTHRKWYATQNKRANKTIEDALEELRLASLVLQQKQTEEEQSAEQLAKASAELTKSVRAEAAAVQRLRADLDPIVAAPQDFVVSDDNRSIHLLQRSVDSKLKGVADPKGVSEAAQCILVDFMSAPMQVR